jgi:hypothetical protein
MQKITVKLNPQFKARTPDPSNASKNYNALFAATVVLETKGGGNSAITTADQDSTIEFFEESDRANPIFTLFTHNMKSVNNLPNFNIDSASNTAGTGAAQNESDFFLRLEFDPATFTNNSQTPFPLIIPFARMKNPSILPAPAPPADRETAGPLPGGPSPLRIRAQVKIAGVPEGDAFRPGGDVLDVPVVHRLVPDFDSPSLTLDNVGVGGVYPIGLFATDGSNPVLLLKPNETIAKTGLTVLSYNLDAVFNNMVPSSFDRAKLETNLTTIFSGIFPSVTVRDATAAEKAQWQLSGGKLWPATIQAPSSGAISTFQTGDGVDMPFFTFLVFAANSLQGQSSEFADAGIYDDPTVRVNVAAGRKKVINPITFPTAPAAVGPGQFNPAYKALSSTDARMAFTANVLAHEICHCLGLLHEQFYDGAQDKYVDNPPVAPKFFVGGAGLMEPNLDAKTPTPLRRLGPVHTALLKRHYP